MITAGNGVKTPGCFEQVCYCICMLMKPIELSCLPGDSQWQAGCMASGVLCVDASPAAQEGANLLYDLVQGHEAIDALPLVSTHGTRADVYQVGNLAVKVFGKRRSSYREGTSGWSILQTSVALHDGLRDMPPQPFYDKWSRTTTSFLYRAPQIYGSFITRNRHSAIPPITVMSFEQGIESQDWEGPQPSYRARRFVCRCAVSAAGLRARDLVIDRNPENVLFDNDDDGNIVLTQLDVLTRQRGAYCM
jgi:hypothetical protein